MKVKIQLDYEALGQVLFGNATYTQVESKAREIATRCGRGYRAGAFRIGKRPVGRVSAVSKQAKRDNLKNNTLLKNMH